MELKVTEVKNIARRNKPSKQYYARSRVYVSPKGETLLDNLINRHDRPTRAYRAAIVEMFPDFKGHMKWSQTAGCSCGCSPAFILDRRLNNEIGVCDVFLTVEAK